MPRLVLLQKAYVQGHHRRTPDGRLVYVQPYFTRVVGLGALVAKARKLHYRTSRHGFPISIEHRRGSMRHGKKMHHPYGYIRGTQGTDGEALDCFVGDCHDATHVYVINKMRPPEFRTVEEQKAFVGFAKKRHAKRAFDAHYTDRRMRGTTHTIPVEQFRQKLRTTRAQPRLLRGTT